MGTNEIVWSRRAAMLDVDYRDFSALQQKAALEGIIKYGTAHRYHAVLATESGEPAGSGVCITSGGRRGILTARHVLDADGEEQYRSLVIGFAPPQDQIIERQLRHEYGPRRSDRPLGPFRTTAISIGDRAIFTPLQRPGKACPDPGLPDIAIVAFSDDIEERLREAASGEGTAVPDPRWFDLDRDDFVGVPYGPTDKDDEMLSGSWLVVGLRGERSGVKKMYCETDGIVIDRIYRRSEYEYYGIFVDEVGGKLAQSRSWKGTSGGGLWQQRLTASGRWKIEQFSPPSLTPEDLDPPVLGGIAFFHETRKSPQELRGDVHGSRHYHGEVYAHRIDGMLLGLIRGALRYGANVAT